MQDIIEHRCGFSKHLECLNQPIASEKKEPTTIVLYKTKLNTVYSGTHDIYLERSVYGSSNSNSRPNSPLNNIPRQNSYINEANLLWNNHKVHLQSFNNGTTIRVIDVQESNIDVNLLYSYSELKRLPVKVVDPEEPEYASDCLVYAYEFINFLKDYNIKYPVHELFILMNVDNLENAYWNGYYLTFGNGITNRSRALVSPAIIGHELFHSVIQHSINLDYYGESGALNESYSDIFGVMFEFWLKEKNKGIGYELGSELFFDGHSMRSFVNPNKCGQPVSIRDPVFYRGHQDNGGVHINSSLSNHLFYKMQLIKDKKIVFNIFINVFFKLKHNSNFNDFKRILFKLCLDNLDYVNIINEIF